MSDLRERLRALIARAATLNELQRTLERFRGSGGTRAAAQLALEELRAESLDEAAEDRVLELLDITAGFCPPERLVWPAPELSWWVMEGSYPRLQWCRARVLLDGSWEVVDGDLRFHRFLDAERAHAWLREEEFVPFDASAREDLLEAGARAEELRPPASGEHEPDLDLTAICGSCGARWHDGEHTPACGECGGGAMLRDCPFCGGACGEVWRRSVLDSNDSREAHWAGGCARG